MSADAIMVAVAEAIADACAKAAAKSDTHYALPLSEQEIAAAVLDALGAHLRSLSGYDLGQAMKEIMGAGLAD